MTLRPDDILQALARCAQEPIHAHGSIQPQGCLIVFDARTLVVTQASANVEAFVGLAPASLLGRAATCWMSTSDADHLARALDVPDEAGFDLLAFGSGPRRLLGSLHLQDGQGLLELEPADVEPALAHHAFIASALRRLAAAPDMPTLAQATADNVRRLLEFDRVLVYRFAADGSGDVVAESCASDLDPYLGLRFPESDIPRQARALYLRGGGAGDSRCALSARAARPGHRPAARPLADGAEKHLAQPPRVPGPHGGAGVDQPVADRRRQAVGTGQLRPPSSGGVAARPAPSLRDGGTAGVVADRLAGSARPQAPAHRARRAAAQPRAGHARVGRLGAGKPSRRGGVVAADDAGLGRGDTRGWAGEPRRHVPAASDLRRDRGACARTRR